MISRRASLATPHMSITRVIARKGGDMLSPLTYLRDSGGLVVSQPAIMGR
jgi:hypothetical protein